jgi:tRNA modification GTPase
LIKVHAKVDLGDRRIVPEGSLPVSSVTGEGVDELVRSIERRARGILPDEDGIALNRRQAAQLEDAAEALDRGARAGDLVIAAEELRAARAAFDRLTGRAGVEDVLDALFSRFCLGK